MDLTPRLSLKKPATVGEVMNIVDLNDNADKLDLHSGYFICTSSTRPATPYVGMQILETDTGNSYFRSNSGKWFVIGVHNCTSTTRPVLADIRTGTIIYEADTYRSYKATSAGWMPMESFVLPGYYSSGAAKVSNDTVVMANYAFNAWAGQSIVTLEINGQVGFESAAVDVGVTVSIASTIVQGTAISQTVQAPASKWATLHHSVSFAIPGGSATSESGFTLNVAGGQSYYRFNTKTTRLPYSVYSSQGAM